MAIIVNKGNGAYEKLALGKQVTVTSDGSLIVISGAGHNVAAYARDMWLDAVTDGDYTAVDDKGEPRT